MLRHHTKKEYKSDWIYRFPVFLESLRNLST
jgi:hypothetical protein